jgi:hypothetical protein
MSKPHPKAKHYTALLKKMEAATAAGFYLEASWIAYAILEDRLVAAMLCAGVRGEFLLGIFPPDHGGNHTPPPAPTPAATTSSTK